MLIEVIVNRFTVAGVDVDVGHCLAFAIPTHISVLYARVCRLDSVLSSIVD